MLNVWRARRSLWRALLCSSALAACVSIAQTGQAAADAASPAPQQTRPEGWSDKSYYLPMRDGTRIAISLYFPGGTTPAEKTPVILIQTRYGRAGVASRGEGGRYKDFVAAGYTVATVDTRGSTASFGPRNVEIGPDEIADMNELIAHVASQPWSNGQVFATGVSYMADTADVATGASPRLAGAIMRETDFDAYLQLFYPGGVYNEMMMRLWGGATLNRDFGRSDSASPQLDCMLRLEDCANLFPRLQPVDEDHDFTLIREAIAGRKHWQPDDYTIVEFRDDSGRNNFPLFASSPAAHLGAIRKQKVPVQYWGSWMDAGTAEAALARYRSLPDIATDVWITGNTHGNDQLTDPLLPDRHDPVPAFDDQIATMMKFLERVRAGGPIGRRIHYYVLGTGEFRIASDWPPKDAVAQTLRLGPSGTLAGADATSPDGQDVYQVDFTATSGKETRWSTQIGTPANYSDQRDKDKRRLVYTSEAFAADTELVGTPSVTLYVSTKTADPAFFVYLEDVAPDGRVSYVTEGQFRAINRKPASESALPYSQSPPLHSFLRADAMPVTPGETFEASFALFPVAARIKAGHRLRIAIAGADVDTFHRYSEGKDDIFTVERSTAHPSSVTIAARPWKDTER